MDFLLKIAEGKLRNTFQCIAERILCIYFIILYPPFIRNEFLANKGFSAPKAVKTGTTIAGFVFKDGVILGADTRATEGNIVADKNCMKLHYMAPNI